MVFFSLLIMLPSEVPKLPTDLSKGFLLWKLLLHNSLPRMLTFVFFFFSILSYLLLKRTGCLSGCLVSSASIVLWKLLNIQISFDEFVGEKVVSCPIPSPSWDHPAGLGIFHGPTDWCVCCKTQHENRKLKTLKFKLHGYRICNVNLIILKFFSSLIRIIWGC